MTRYYGLVLIPDETPEEDIYNVAANLLYPHMRNEREPGREYAFDWFVQPDDIGDDESELAEYVWRVPDILDRFSELEVEAILTPSGQWHHSESGLWDEPGWVGEAQ